MERDKTKVRILEATISIFNRKGLKFTMDDIAAELGMSKKTIYTVFRDKESLYLKMVDYCFDRIKESEEEVLSDTSLNLPEKIRKILGVLPEGYQDVDFSQLYMLRSRYPNIYQKVEERLESGWEKTIMLLEKGMEEGVVKPINIAVFKTMMEATLEKFFQRDVLVREGLSYKEALDEVVRILVDGILVQQGT